MHHCCDNKLINQSCYGSVPGKSSLDPVLIKTLEYDITILTREILLSKDLDSTACYDRMIPFFANCISQKYGQHQKVCIVQGRTMKEARYHLRTKFGISKTSAQHSKLIPWFGTGQGAGNSGMYWVMISSDIIDIYETKARGATYSSPCGNQSITIYISAFVDDATTRTNHFLANPPATVPDIANQASTDCQIWHDLLAAVDQALELTKCKYHLIHFKFEPSGEPTMVDDQVAPAELQVRDKNNNPVTITHVPSNKQSNTSGVNAHQPATRISTTPS
jgi:hypothetical protein